MTKDALLDWLGYLARSRYRSDTKPQIVDASVRDLSMSFMLGRPISYTLSEGNLEKQHTDAVSKQTAPLASAPEAE